MAQALLNGVDQILLEDVAADETESEPFAIPPTLNAITLYVFGSDGVSAGAIQFFAANTPDAIAWAPFGDPVTVPNNGVTIVNLPSPINLAAIKAQVETAVADGTATVIVNARRIS